MGAFHETGEKGRCPQTGDEADPSRWVGEGGVLGVRTSRKGVRGGPGGRSSRGSGGCRPRRVRGRTIGGCSRIAGRGKKRAERGWTRIPDRSGEDATGSVAEDLAHQSAIRLHRLRPS